MWEFIQFIRYRITDIADMLDTFNFDISGMSVSIFDLFFGFVAMSIVISLFWKGVRG